MNVKYVVNTIKKRKKKFIFVTAFERGEKVAVDIIGPIGKQYIISAIDYFTREGFAKVLSSRNDEKVVSFIEDVNEKVKIKTLILDQSKENLSSKVVNFCKHHNIELHYTSPYHHQSNGRVERFNRTLQDLIFKNKEDSFLKTKLKRAIEIYNNTFHTGILMTPQEATLLNVQDKLRQIQMENIIKYNKKNGKGEQEHFFRPGEVVLIRQEGNRGKGSPKFKVRGCVYKALKNNAFIIKIGKKKIKRHASQLKLLVDEPIL